MVYYATDVDSYGIGIHYFVVEFPMLGTLEDMHIRIIFNEFLINVLDMG